MLKKFVGNQKHHLDCRVYSSEPEGEDWQLHQCILDKRLFNSLLIPTQLERPVVCSYYD
jgi:hypothetical protein